MALKDWIKVARVFPHWRSKENDNKVSIIKTLQIREKYYVQYGSLFTSKRKFFMTKDEAFKFAKQYMRTH
jgi:hypothetical protein